MTIDAHVKAKQIALGRSIADRKKIYLDLNFWIVARNAALGLRTDEPALALLHQLRTGVALRKIVCPVGDNFFLELMKQPLSEDRRLGTARLVDELSLGVSMMVSDRRVATEIYVLMHGLMGRPGTLHPMQELVWTKVCHILGETYPVVDGVDAATMLELQRGFIDALWETPLTEMIHRIGGAWDRDEDEEQRSAEANRQRDKHAAEITSFEGAYEIELRGGIDVYGTIAAKCLCSIGADEGHQAPTPADADAWKGIENLGRNALFHAFKRKNAADIVRTLHIETALHAAMRVDKARRFKPNDFYDLRHAAAAMAYCDVFLTEGPLRNLVERKQLGLLGINNCQVASEIGDAVNLLTEIVGGESS